MNTTTRLLFTSLLFASICAAQVPPHHAIVGTISVPFVPVRQSGTTGIFLVPLPTSARPGPQTPVPVTGLPPSLTVQTPSFGGVYSILHRPEDGAIFAGAIHPAGQVAAVHMMHLRGTHVVSSTSIAVGRVASGYTSGVAGLSLFPDGRILVASNSTRSFTFGSGPGAVSALSVIDTSGAAPTIQPLPLSGATIRGVAEKCLVTADGRTAYLTSHSGGGAAPWNLYAVDVDATSPTYGDVEALYTWANEQVFRPELGGDGRIHVARTDLATSRTRMDTIDARQRPIKVSTSAFLSKRIALFGPSTAPSTDRSVFGSPDTLSGLGGMFANSVVLGSRSGGPFTLLAAEPAGGWGFPFAIDVYTAFERYGVGTDGANHYEIVEGIGLPEIGNAGFGIAVRATGSAAFTSWLIVGTRRQSLQVLGVELLATLDVVVPMPPGPQPRVDLPLPLDPALVGATLHAQGVHAEAGGFATSDAVRIQIVR